MIRPVVRVEYRRAKPPLHVVGLGGTRVSVNAGDGKAYKISIVDLINLCAARSGREQRRLTK